MFMLNSCFVALLKIAELITKELVRLSNESSFGIPRICFMSPTRTMTFPTKGLAFSALVHFGFEAKHRACQTSSKRNSCRPVC